MNSSSPPCVFDHPPSGQRLGVGIAQTAPFNGAAFEAAVNDLLRASGVAADSVHTGKTAKRVRELWEKRLLGGYSIAPADALGEGFADDRQDMVVVRGIAIHGVCPHHLVPFRGIAHVAYIPGGRLHGFGRIARMVDAIGHRFTYQEWMTRDIVEALVSHGQARGNLGGCRIFAYAVEGAHLQPCRSQRRFATLKMPSRYHAWVADDESSRRFQFPCQLPPPRHTPATEYQPRPRLEINTLHQQPSRSGEKLNEDCIISVFPQALAGGRLAGWPVAGWPVGRLAGWPVAGCRLPVAGCRITDNG